MCEEAEASLLLQRQQLTAVAAIQSKGKLAECCSSFRAENAVFVH
jgi:hypothetical protein